MSSRLIFLVIACLIVVFVLLAVFFAHNVQKKQKAYFSIIGLSLIYWQLMVYITEGITTNLQLLNNLTFWGPALALFGSYKVADLLSAGAQDRHLTLDTKLKKLSRLSDGVVYGVSGLMLAALLSNQIFTRVIYSAQSGYVYERGLAYFVYIAGILVLLACVTAKLSVGYYAARKDFQGRLAIKVFITSVGLTSLYGLVTNVIVPLAANTDRYLPLGLLSIDIFAGGLAIAIIRYRFLDIRSYVFRSVVYVFTLVAIAVAYVLLTSFVLGHLLEVSLSGAVILLLSTLTLITAVSFQPLYRYFNKLTSKVFYRDAYEPQDLFNEYNKALVSTIDLDVLLRRTSKVLATYLNSEFCSFAVKDGGDHGYVVLGTQGARFSSEDLALVRSITPHIHKTVITLDQIKEEHSSLRQVFNKHGIAALVRLNPNAAKTQEGLGYMVLGTKKSGNPYNSQDIKIIETLANELIIALQNVLRFEEIERFNETLQQRVNEATAQLRHANKRLKELNESKDDFIGMASHQLRTPLTSIKGYISLVMDGDVGKVNANQRKLLQQAFVSSQRMVFLIADLLNVSRLRTGKFVIERAPTDLSKLISDELAQLKEAAAVRNVELIYYPPAKFPVLPLDETKTRQVIMNFIDNAIYYTPSGGHIKVELTELPKSIELRVVDDGIGVPKSEHHNLFTKFYRAKNAQRARPDGTGLGLFMAKKVIVAQGGAPIFSSEEGKGSTFGFTFPKDLKPTDGGAPEPVAADD